MHLNPMREFTLSVLFTIAAFSLSMAASNRSEYYQRVFNLNTVIDIKMNNLVEEQIDLIINKKTKDSRYVLGRTSLYFPKIENILREKGLPDELKYIAVIESSLQPEAVSRQGATGLWQFMRGTAIIYGMEVSKYIDERKDVEISTDKATSYLAALYNIYGNWTVALAAYNCGPGNVNKAIKKAGGVVDYWKISAFLPRETREYIPKFIAASYLMNYYFLHDLTPIEPSPEIKFTGSVRVFEKLHFKDLEKQLGLDLGVIQKLNPIYIKNLIPESKSGKYVLTLPEEALITYLEKTQNFEHLVHLSSGKTIISHLYSTGVHQNEVKINEAGMAVLQHRLTELFSSHPSNEAISRNLQPARRPKNYHVLKKKESLASVAEKNNMELDELLKLNSLSSEEEVAIQTKITLETELE
jgi:hypothetical protein